MRVAGAGEARARALAAGLGAEAVPFAELASADADLLLIAVPDRALPGVAARLARRRQAPVALHTAGGQGASTLLPLREAGSAVGTLHPLLAFPEVLPDPEAARGAFFAIDGDEPARALAQRLAESWNGTAAEVPEALRPLYHLAASVAAGGVVTLLAVAQEIAERTGLPAAAVPGYFRLAAGALAAAVHRDDPGAAITGPAARGDRETFGCYLPLLEGAAPDLVAPVVSLALETLRQCARRAPLTTAQEALRRDLLDRVGER